MSHPLSPPPSQAKAEPQEHSKVILLDRRVRRVDAAAWDRLTVRLVMRQHERGELPLAVVEAMLAGIGLQP